MPAAQAKSIRTIALLGNPNTGKSTLFSALVGVRQHVGNYPGVTVEKKTGQIELAGQRFELIDLPGLYSLAARSRDEMVAVDVLLDRLPEVGPVDAVILVVDASNLHRHLYLASQVLELGLPTIVAVNMIDLLPRRGMQVDLAELQRRLGVPVIGVQANRGLGLDAIRDAIARTTSCGAARSLVLFPEVFEREVSRLESLLSADGACSQCVRSCGECPGAAATSLVTISPNGGLPRPLVRRLLLDASGYLRGMLFPEDTGRVEAGIEAARARLAEAGCLVPAVETSVRYDWVRRVLEGVVVEPNGYRPTISDRLDRVLTHRTWGTVVFALVVTAVFQAVFAGARPATDLIEAVVAATGDAVRSVMAEGALRSLLVDGVIGGVGSVVAFLPQILVLFLFIGLLEDCGYMARAAYLMDRFMSRVGLSGRSFIPMLSSFACTVPGIMAARVIENDRDRLTTILVSPLLTCSARLPVYALLIAAFIPETAWYGMGLQGLTLVGLYVLGIVAAVVMAMVLKGTLLRGHAPPFLMELPSYKWPSARTILYRVAERGWIFLRSAGSLILAVSVIVWAAAYYPHDRDSVSPLLEQREAIAAQLDQLPQDAAARPALVEQTTELDGQIAAGYQRGSLLGQLGRAIEPAVRPLGWDWRIGCSVLASFPAREVVVATLGVVFAADHPGKGDEAEGRLREHLRSATWEGTDRPLFTLPVALSLMVFYALCAQCAPTLAVMRRETNSWRWPAFAFAYMTVLAYVGALVAYQGGTWLGW